MYLGHLLWETSSWSESAELLAWRTESSTSGLGSFREQSSPGSWFSRVSGACPYCGCRKKSSRLDRAPKLPDSVRLISWESFLMTLLSIDPEMWVIYSSVIPEQMCSLTDCSQHFPVFPMKQQLTFAWSSVLPLFCGRKKTNNKENWIRFFIGLWFETRR